MKSITCGFRRLTLLGALLLLGAINPAGAVEPTVVVPNSARTTTISPVINKPRRAFGTREPWGGIGLTISILLNNSDFPI